MIDRIHDLRSGAASIILTVGAEVGRDAAKALFTGRGRYPSGFDHEDTRGRCEVLTCSSHPPDMKSCPRGRRSHILVRSDSQIDICMGW